MRKPRLTPRQRGVLTHLARAGASVVADDYWDWRDNDGPTRFERTLAVLARHKLIVWDGPVSEIEVTEEGRRRVQTTPHPP